MKNEKNRIAGGLAAFGEDPCPNEPIVAESDAGRIEAMRTDPDELDYELTLTHPDGRKEDIPFFVGSPLHLWMEHEKPVRDLIAEIGWKIARHESLYGNIGISTGCYFTFQILIDHPEDRALLLLELARAYERTRSWEKALRHYSQVVALEPLNEAVWKAGLRGMSRAHHVLGDPELSSHFCHLANQKEAGADTP